MFTLSDDVVVNGAKLEDGMLYVDLERIIPDAKKNNSKKLSQRGELTPPQQVNNYMTDTKTIERSSITKKKKKLKAKANKSPVNVE